MSIRNVLNNLDLVLSKKDLIMRRTDIGTIIIKEAGISANNHIPFTLENLVRLWTENPSYVVRYLASLDRQWLRLNYFTKHPRQNSNGYDFGEDLDVAF